MAKRSGRYDRLAYSVLIAHMEQFASLVKAEDFAMLPIDPAKKTQYTTNRQPRKTKGGKPPIDYIGIDDFVDLRIHLSRAEFSQAIPIYFRLKRMLNW